MEKNIEIICKALSSKKSVLIGVLNVRGLTSIADDFILATTRNKKQAQAAADEVEEKADILVEEKNRQATHATKNRIFHCFLLLNI